MRIETCLNCTSTCFCIHSISRKRNSSAVPIRIGARHHLDGTVRDEKKSKKKRQKEKKKGFPGPWRFDVPTEMLVKPEHRCFTCGKRHLIVERDQKKVIQGKKCPQCKVIHYCGVKCQKEDWTDPMLVYQEMPDHVLPTHKENCDGFAQLFEDLPRQPKHANRPVFFIETVFASDNIKLNILTSRNNPAALERALEMGGIYLRELVATTSVFEWMEAHFSPCTVIWSCAGKSQNDPHRLVLSRLKPPETREEKNAPFAHFIQL